MAFTRGVAIGLGLLVGAAGLGCSNSPEATRASAELTVDAGGVVAADAMTVSVPPGALREDATLTVERVVPEQAPAWNAGMTPVSDAFAISLSRGALNDQAHIEVLVDGSSVPAGTPADSVFLASFNARAGGWVPTKSSYDPTTGVVESDSEHFSLWRVWVADPRVLSGVINDAIDVVTRGLDLRAVPPECNPATSGIEIHGPVTGSNPPLKVCVEGSATASAFLVKLANNRAYAILVSDPSGGVTYVGTRGGSIAQHIARSVQRAIGTEVFLVPPGGELQVELHVSAGEGALLSTQATWLSVGLDLILSITSALAPGDGGLVLSALECYQQTMGLGSTDPGSGYALDALLGAVKECVSAVPGPVGRLWGSFMSGVTLGGLAGDLVRDHGMNQTENRLSIVNANVPPMTLGHAKDVVAEAGYTVISEETWSDSASLKVLVGYCTGSVDGACQQAFFFSTTDFLGTDSPEVHFLVEVVGQTEATVTLRYGLFQQPNWSTCCPDGYQNVRFQFDGRTVRALDPIPPVVVPGEEIDTPEAAALELFRAWEDGDEDAARFVATADAVALLFNIGADPGAFEFVGCSSYGGGESCNFVNPGGEGPPELAFVVEPNGPVEWLVVQVGVGE